LRDHEFCLLLIAEVDVMTTESDGHRPRVFVSFTDDMESVDWVKHAHKFLVKRFDVFDYRPVPMFDLNISPTLTAVIQNNEVFICLLSKKYYDNKTTVSELKTAIEHSTGSSAGLLSQQKLLPLVFLIAMDRWAENWIRETQPDFTYFSEKNLGFAPSGPGDFVAIEPRLWDSLFRNIQDRLRAIDGGSTRNSPSLPPSSPEPVGRKETSSFARMHLFVSHVRQDQGTAESIVAELETRGVPCWIAPRDVRPGRPFDVEISDAIDNCFAMFLVFSDQCNESDYIRREVTVANEGKKLIIPFRIENAKPRSGLRLRLNDLHWIDAFSNRDAAIGQLLREIDRRSAIL
jgi:hypothetical protein